MDADGSHEVQWTAEGNRVRIRLPLGRDAIFIATRNPTLRTAIEARRQAALLRENLNTVNTIDLEMLVGAPAE